MELRLLADKTIELLGRGGDLLRDGTPDARKNELKPHLR
jgi:hypothetical protein